MNLHAIDDAAAAAPRLRAVESVVLHVRFASTAGAKRTALGGGTTVGEAIGSAREALPRGTWVAVSWDELYGD
jgi:hypothetical protein